MIKPFDLTIGFCPEQEPIEAYLLRFAFSISPLETTQVVVSSHNQLIIFSGVGINGPYSSQVSTRLLWVWENSKFSKRPITLPTEIVLARSETNRKVLPCFELPEDLMLTPSHSIGFNRQEVNA